jgi:hypothetical protein
VAARKASARAADDSADAGRSGTIPACFDIQEHPIASAHHYVECRSCKMRWFLPKDAERRTAVALDVLADHAASHRVAEQREHRSAP